MPNVQEQQKIGTRHDKICWLDEDDARAGRPRGGGHGCPVVAPGVADGVCLLKGAFLHLIPSVPISETKTGSLFVDSDAGSLFVDSDVLLFTCSKSVVRFLIKWI